MVLRRGRSAEVAHAHFGYALPYTRVLQRRAGVPVVVSLHGDDATSWAAANPWAYQPDPSLVAAVVVPSRWLAARAVALGFDASQVHVIPAGVDTSFFTPSAVPLSPVVGFVGRLVEKKGIDTLMAAWPRVQAAGTGRDAARGGRRAARVARPRRRRHAHRARRRRVAMGRCGPCCETSRVIATPSQTAANGDAESLLLVNLEAQAAGRPVVTTRHGGIPEFVAENSSAVVVTERSPADLADALVRVLTDDALAQRLGAGGPRVAAEFDVAAMAAKVDDLYDDVVGRRST